MSVDPAKNNHFTQVTLRQWRYTNDAVLVAATWQPRESARWLPKRVIFMTPKPTDGRLIFTVTMPDWLATKNPTLLEVKPYERPHQP